MTVNSDVLNSQAIDLASHGDYPEAIACFISALKMDRGNYLLWYNLGVTYRDAGNLEAAREALLAAYKLNDSDEDVLDSLSLVLLAMDREVEGFKYLEKALEINPHSPHLWNNTGVFYFHQGEYAKACDAFEHAVSLSPHYYDALYNLRDTYTELGNKVGAEECARRLKELKDIQGAPDA